MTAAPLLGLLVLNLLFLMAGAGLLIALRPVSGWSEALRLAPLAYLVGTVVMTVLFVNATILFDSPSRFGIAGLSLAVCVAGFAIGRRRRHLRSAPQPPNTRREPFRLLGGAFAALTGVILVDLLAFAWTKPVTAWDAWSFWVPKSLALFYEGGLDVTFQEIAARTYPLFVPVLDAAGFEMAGEAVPSALHVQHILLAFGFVGSVAALVRPRVPGVLVWPFLALAVVLPATGARFASPEADFVVVYCFVLASLCIGLWTLEHSGWLLLTGGVFLAGGLAAKREGALFLVAVCVAAVAASGWRAWRDWGRVLLVACGAVLTALPWQLWLRSNEIRAESTGRIVSDGGVVGDAIEEPHRVLPAIGKVLAATFSYDLWLVAPTIGAVALVSALVLGRERRLATFVLVASLVAATGFTWRILWGTESLDAFDSQSLPTNRNVIALVLLWLSFTPLFVREALRGATPEWGLLARLRSIDVPARTVALTVIVPVLAYAFVVAARGDFALAGREDCSPPPGPGGPIDVVLGRAASMTAAASLQDHVAALGFVETKLSRDRCGEPKVYVPDLPSMTVARELAAEARGARLQPSIEGR